MTAETHPTLTAARAFHEDATRDRQAAVEAWDESLADLRAAQRLLETCKARHAAAGAAVEAARTTEARAKALLDTATIINPAGHGNAVAREGVDRCACGCKYWERDRCIDCGTPVQAAGNQDS